MQEELLIRYCAPTLAGIKTGSLFSCAYTTKEEIFLAVRAFNRLLGSKGLRVVPICLGNGRALIYIYRPSQLRQDFGDCHACQMLTSRGYQCGNPELCIAQLIKKVRTETEFPHEIGLFLGYPPEDVAGFMQCPKGAGKCSGLWKVYGDEHQAQKLFATYKKCSHVYYNQWVNGKSIERLTVAV